MEATHIQKYIHTSPRKLRLVADMVRKMSPDKALDALTFTANYAADDLKKAIKTALGNAKQLGLDEGKTSFKALEINESMKMRRYQAGTRGRAKPFRRKMSHIKIVLTDQLSVLSPQLSDKGRSVVSKSVTDKQTTDKPESENRKPKTDNRRTEK